MIDFIAPVAAWFAAIIETIGIATITLFALYALYNAATRMLKKEESESVYQELRQSLGRGILLGLELLIASDIIYTVAVELTFETIGVLAIVVLIRTFLSLTLEVEMSGKWPWQNNK
ncbi:hypothetical protein DIT71_05875 [Marinobacter vulgaris]|uniref:DUF1622 domain-containing protein n=1 Tax=Marinobacter vulgaris TaxID=1928331 RepID=A0A2V3ZP98_9GAMM|nr:DUF1622 domain-containing protein [Marinobacter vulgaris]PXX92811.1 hypothetical protein DIT71_05875 [Marinobacter vulgaris]TSJ71347.1 DUF1622 domain-containing protein [Marinobacter vulgaris]